MFNLGPIALVVAFAVYAVGVSLDSFAIAFFALLLMLIAAAIADAS